MEEFTVIVPFVATGGANWTAKVVVLARTKKQARRFAISYVQRQYDDVMHVGSPKVTGPKARLIYSETTRDS